VNGSRWHRVLIALGALMGAAGVMLAAAAAHQPDAGALGTASSMLLFHALAVLATVVLLDRQMLRNRCGTAAACGFLVGAVLFAGDLTIRHYAGQRLFPYAAPTGGTLMIASWVALTLSVRF